MSKKPSEHQKSDRKFPNTHVRPGNASATSNDENSLERRLFVLIGNELRRTTSPNEFASLENRIIRILRNEFVNDIMIEINTSDDEISTFFNRFIRSVPELSELCERLDGNVRDGVGSKAGSEKAKQSEGQSEENKQSRRIIDEDSVSVALEMFRASILVICRSCENMRRIIRSGRRMIREIQMIAALRSDLNTFRRIEMKPIEELDPVRHSRYRRHVNNISTLRQLLRRNVHLSSNLNRNSYCIVFDRMEKPRLAQITPKAKYEMLTKLRERGKEAFGKMRPQTRTRRSWDESGVKSEIGRILQALRRICSLSTSSMKDSTPETITLKDAPIIRQNVDLGTRPPADRNFTNIEDLATTHLAINSSHLLATSPVNGNLPSNTDIRNSKEDNGQAKKSSTRPAGGRMVSTFSVSLRTGAVPPEDITVVLYSDRVLVASVARRFPSTSGAWSGWLQRRWLLPAEVNVDEIRCFLGRGTLLITVLPVPDFIQRFGLEYQELGPPERVTQPYPHPYSRPQ